MISPEELQNLKAQWESISHGPVFPLDLLIDEGRIEDANGNVVFEPPHNFLPECMEYLVMAGNELPRLIAEVERLQKERMKPWAVFDCPTYYPRGGMEDFVAAFDTKEKAEEFIKSQPHSIDMYTDFMPNFLKER